MKDDGSQQEDVTGLFRKFGGDAAAYKEFAPQQIPASANPVATPPVKRAGAQKVVQAAAPASVHEAPAFVPPPADALPTAAAVAPTEAAAPSALDLLFARLDGQPAVPAPVVARGLMAHWRKPT
jgi:hypothetical protein